MLEQRSPGHWLLPGNVENWSLGVERRIWGLRDSPRSRSIWRTLESGDYLYFYVTRPISGVVGVGRVGAKFMGAEPLWPDEIEEGKVIYPLRFEFEIEQLLDPKKWAEEAVTVKDLGIGIISIGQIPDEKVNALQKRIQEAWPQPVPASQSSHQEIKELLMEIGKMKGFVVEDEYAIDNERLDVVWKKVRQGVPTYAFEVQVGGEIYRALGKLKHAFDIWNTRIYLVLAARWQRKAEKLLSGTFHEIKDQITLIPLDQVKELREVLKKLRQVEARLGL